MPAPDGPEGGLHIVVCAKQVLDPDGVNSFAFWGRLQVGADGRSFDTGEMVPRIINAYDEQAVEAALRIRDAGVDCRITVVTVGDEEAGAILKRCVAMGADDAVQIVDAAAGLGDGFRTARLLAGLIEELGDVDLVLCGRQSSDYDQGTTPAALAEMLGYAYVTVAFDVRVEDERLRIKRATPLGEEQVLASMPTVVTISNELGIPRYPTGRGMIAARRHPATVKTLEELGVEEGGGAELLELYIHEVAGECEFIEGDDPAAQAAELLSKLEAEGVL